MCHNIQLDQHSAFESSAEKSHESKVTLGASGKSCCTISLGSHFRNAWFNCWCQFFRCLTAIFVISQPEALVLGLFIIIVIVFGEKEGGLFCTHGYEAVGALFLLFHDVAILLCDKRHGGLFRRSQGDRWPQWGTGTRLNVSFSYSDSRATGALALAEIHSSLSRMPAHQWCGGK